jgi:hypothetical protein
MGTWALFKAAAQKKLSWGTTTDSRKRVDASAPLGIRIGGMLTISSPDFILGDGKLKIKGPAEDLYVISYGQFRLGNYLAHRFYLSAGEQLYMLQIIEEVSVRPGEPVVIDECKLYALHDEVYPGDKKEEWDFWLNDTTGYIGYSEFNLKDGTIYYRAWENQAEQCDAPGGFTHIPPVEIRESIYMDPYGDDVQTVGHMAMLYGRSVMEGLDEYLFVGVAEQNDGASVQFSIGIPLNTTDITVLF